MKAFNIRELDGCKKVYAFTLRGLVFSKSNIISAIIMLLLSFVSPFLISTFSENIDTALPSEGYYTLSRESGIGQIYIKNETGIDFDLSPYTDAEISAYEKSEEEFKTEKTSVLYHIFFDAESYGYKVNTVISLLSSGDLGAASEFAFTVSSVFDDARYKAYGISEKDAAELFSPTSVGVSDAESYFQSRDDKGFEVRFAVQYLYAIVVLILVTFSATYIIRAVLEEKASKLVETLMVSVRPLALITGKILAAMTYIFGLLIALFASVGLSSLISSAAFGTKVSLDAVGFDLSGIKFDIPTLVLIIIALLLGYLTYSILAGIAGAACGSMEELEGANSSVMLTVLFGYIISCMTSAIPSKALALFTSLCPIISTFSAPAHYILGNISLPILLISFLLQAAVVALLMLFCSKVYSELIMRKGSRLKLKEVFKLYILKR